MTATPNSDTANPQWVLASNNKGKLNEFKRLFAAANLNIDIVPQGELNIDDAVEDGLSFIENAIIKADLDKVANYLLLLQQANIPVIWRPLHEAAGTWFWWRFFAFNLSYARASMALVLVGHLGSYFVFA